MKGREIAVLIGFNIVALAIVFDVMGTQPKIPLQPTPKNEMAKLEAKQEALIQQIQLNNGVLVHTVDIINNCRQTGGQLDPYDADRLLHDIHEELDKSYEVIYKTETP